MGESGIIILVLCWVTIAAVAGFIVLRVRDYDRAAYKPLVKVDRLLPIREEFLLAAVCVSLTLLGVRLLYQIIGTFSSSSDFDLVSGNETVRLCMATIEEYVIVIVQLSAGLALKKLRLPAEWKEQRTGAARYLQYVPFVHWFIR